MFFLCGKGISWGSWLCAGAAVLIVSMGLHAMAMGLEVALFSRNRGSEAVAAGCGCSSIMFLNSNTAGQPKGQRWGGGRD